METLKKLSAILLITIFMSSQALYAGVDTSKLKDTDDKQGIIPLLAVCLAITIVTCKGKAEQTTSDGTKTSGSIEVEVKK